MIRNGVPKIRVFVVDDHHLVRRGLRLLLEGQADFVACGEAQSASEAVAGVATHKPDVVILDLTLKSEDGFDWIEELHLAYPGLRILVFTMHAKTMYAEKALAAGAIGYLLKTEPAEKLFDALRSVAHGIRYVTPSVDRVLLDSQAGLEWMMENGIWSVRPRIDS